MREPIFTDEQVKIFAKEFAKEFAFELVYWFVDYLGKWIRSQNQEREYMMPAEYFIKLLAKYLGEAVSKKSNGDKQ